MEAREGIYLGLNREGTIIIAINLIIDMIAVHIWILLEMLCGHHMYLHNCRGGRRGTFIHHCRRSFAILCYN